ncbi:TonB-dependent receptor [candidate division KSB1 bacterium]|nr:TonB-dependent receptor [candidate division KSB1 bacterium]
MKPIRDYFDAWHLALFVILAASSTARGAEVSGEQSGRWTLAASPYIVTGNVAVPEGRTLTIEPGVIVKFAGYYSLKVNGTLRALGSPANRIVFTSGADNEYDDLGLAISNPATSNDWSGIEFTDSSNDVQSRMENCVIKYCTTPLVISRAWPRKIESITISHSGRRFVKINGMPIPFEDGAEQDYFIGEDIDNPPATMAAMPPENSETPEPAAEPPGDLPPERSQPIVSPDERGAIRGIVTDVETGRGMAGANLAALPLGGVGTTTETVSGAAGDFELKNLAPGLYTITASSNGYAKKVFPALVINPGEEKTLDVALPLVGSAFNPAAISASRHPEKIFDTPAAISVVEAAPIRLRSALTVAEHLRAMPGVDFADTGINQALVALRGFNDFFAGAVLPLTDHRITRLPALRFSPYNLIPLTNDDVESIEIVSGPGSALYGPNSANGVVHFITKSPFGSEGTTLSAGGGERVEYFGSARHAGSWQNRLGYKISAQYFRGVDWKYEDPAEPDFFTIGGIKTRAPGRDFRVEKISGEARVDLRLSDDLTAIGNAGYSQASDIELTGFGAVQAKKYAHSYLQSRLLYKDFFAQAFYNSIDAGNSYFLRTGAPIIDKSVALGGQIQHSFLYGDGQRFTYGLDILQTFPITQGTLTGRNEAADNIYENGVFLQSATELSTKISLLAALRVDDHSRMKKRVVSSRAALVYSLSTEHKFRATYNRGFSMPGTEQLSFDLLIADIPSSLPTPFSQRLMARAFGVPFETGFTFRRDTGGRPLMLSPLAPEAGYLPATVNSIWPSLREILIASSPANQQALLNTALPAQLNGTVLGDLRKLNPTTKKFDPFSDITDVAPLKPTITNTLELGYKGLFGEMLFFSANVYHTRIENFISPLAVETPNVFANTQQLTAALQPAAKTIANALIAQGTAPEDAPAQAQAMINNLVTAAANLPLGVISPNEIATNNEIILTYRNFGDIALNGMELSFIYSPNASWKFSGNFSYLSKNFFHQTAQQAHAPLLNAPKHKFGAGVQYRDPANAWEAQLRWRYVGGFPVKSGVYFDGVETYTAVDLDLGCDLGKRTRLFLTVQNALNWRHRNFAGAPKIGRLLLARIAQTF